MTPASKEWVSDRQFGTWVAAAFGLSVVSPWRPLWAYRQDVSRETSGIVDVLPRCNIFVGSDLRPRRQRTMTTCCLYTPTAFPNTLAVVQRIAVTARDPRTLGRAARISAPRGGALSPLQDPRPRESGTGTCDAASDETAVRQRNTTQKEHVLGSVNQRSPALEWFKHRFTAQFRGAFRQLTACGAL